MLALNIWVLALLSSCLISYGIATPVFLQPRALDVGINPFDGAVGHIDEEWTQKIKGSTFPNAEIEGKANTVMKQSTAVWIDTIANLARVSSNMQKARSRANALGQPVVIQFVVYDLPGRDCHALSSNGELKAGQDAEYRGYIDNFAKRLNENAADNVRVVLIIEPDSLPNLATNLANPKCAEAANSYKTGVAYALAKLSLPNVWMYVDIAHGGWLGWKDGQEKGVAVFKSVIGDARQQAQSLGNAFRLAGWASNVANYSPVTANGVPPATQFPLVTREGRLTYDYNPCIDELTFTTDMAKVLSASGLPSRFIIDTSRNGVRGIRSHWGHWCNIRGAGIGFLPTVKPYSHVDAYVWVKPPGESDGHSTGDPRDGFCDPTNQQYGADAMSGAPRAGQWFQSQFIQLVEKATPPLANSGGIRIEWRTGNWAIGCDWEGNDLTNAPSTGEQCGSLCAKTSGCTHFTFSTYNGGTCWMKKGNVLPENAKNTGDQSIVCGFMNYVNWDGKNWARGCDWNGNDVGSEGSTGEQCGQICADTSACTHFTWSSYNGGTCWMKGGRVSKGDAFRTTDGTMVCGIIETPVIPSPSPSPPPPPPFTMPSMNSWMSKLDDNTLLWKTLIPGTHDSGTYEVDSFIMKPYTRCQDWDISTQLSNGIRFLDSRWAYQPFTIVPRAPSIKESLYIVHGDAILGSNLDELTFPIFMKQVYDFLDANPTEVVFMRVKDERNEIDKFCSIWEKFVGSNSHRWIKPVSSENLTLGQARGKIVPLFNAATKEISQCMAQKFGMEFGASVYSKDDIYEFDKNSEGVEHYLNTKFVNSKNHAQGTFYLCQSSGYEGTVPGPRDFADVLNPVVLERIETELELVKRGNYDFNKAPKGFHNMDFPSETHVQRMVELSLRIQALQ